MKLALISLSVAGVVAGAALSAAPQAPGNAAPQAPATGVQVGPSCAQVNARPNRMAALATSGMGSWQPPEASYSKTSSPVGS